MRKLVYILFIFIYPAGITCGQEIDFSRISLGVSAGYISPTGEMGKNWDNSFSIGVPVEYRLNEYFSISSGVKAANFKAVDNPGKTLPDIWYFVVPAEIEARYPAGTVSPFVSAGLQNSIFYFYGSDNVSSENSVEQEIGYTFSAGLDIKIYEIIAGAFYRYNRILSEPENIVFNEAGVRLFFR